MKTSRSIFYYLCFLITLLVSCYLMGCASETLQPGGPYAPTNSLGQPIQAPDVQFYQADAGFKFAHEAVITAFQLEYDNRAMLFKLSPQVKHGLDAIRPDFNAAVAQWALARDAYKANPTPAGLTGLQQWLSKLQQLAQTAQAVTTNLNLKAN